MPRENEQIGPYTLTRFLGRGGFGDVWQAVERTAFSSNEFALKFVRPDGNNGVDLGAVRAEVEKWQQACGHPNIMPFIKADVYGEHIVLVSEYADGGSLGHWLRQHGGRAPDVAEAVRMTRGILRGVIHLHGRKLLHRDLKPENVLLQGGHPRLIDFGISGVLSTRTDTKTLSGTLPYMPPEAFKKKKSEHTDIWAVGVMLYQMLAGRPPFDAPDDAALMYQILLEEPKALPNSVPAALRGVVTKALAKEREDRFQTSAQMLEALEKALQPVAPQPRPVVIPPPIVRPVPAPAPAPAPAPGPAPAPAPTPAAWRKWSLVVGGVALALILGVGGIRFLSGTVATPDGTTTAKTKNSLGMEFVKVPAGNFEMGDDNGSDDEKPAHNVVISQPFLMQTTEVTQAQWKSVMGSLPDKCDYGSLTGGFVGDNKPVICVSWDDVQEFIRRLNAKGEGTYRLPTEAEWEYAARAGTSGDYAGSLDDMAWYDKNSGGVTHPVGEKKPNGWGLYDMHGNVWEWCQDWYDSGYYKNSPGRDPQGPDTGTYRVNRGGGWDDDAAGARAAPRHQRARQPRHHPRLPPG